MGGGGLAALPHILVHEGSSLKMVATDVTAPTRDLWFLSHRDLGRSPHRRSARRLP